MNSFNGEGGKKRPGTTAAAADDIPQKKMKMDPNKVSYFNTYSSISALGKKSVDIQVLNG